MKDKGLLKIALLWSVIGIFILIAIVVLTAPSELKISELENHVDETVTVSGSAKLASYKENVAFVDIADETGKITVVIFDKVEDYFHKDDYITVKGKVSIYKGELEIIADEIICNACKVTEKNIKYLE